jgi:hypothetical protein
MRLLLAMFKLETNTFSPVPTPFERFWCGGRSSAGCDLSRRTSRTSGRRLHLNGIKSSRIRTSASSAAIPDDEEQGSPLRAEAGGQRTGAEDVCQEPGRAGRDGRGPRRLRALNTK